MKLFDVGTLRATLVRTLAAPLAIAAVACVPSARDDELLEPMRNANEAGLSLAMCGTVDDFEAPRPPEEDGALSIDGRRWTVLARATLDAPDLLAPGEDICIKATMDPQSRIERCAVSQRAP